MGEINKGLCESPFHMVLANAVSRRTLRVLGMSDGPVVAALLDADKQVAGELSDREHALLDDIEVALNRSKVRGWTE